MNDQKTSPQKTKQSEENHELNSDELNIVVGGHRGRNWDNYGNWGGSAQ